MFGKFSQMIIKCSGGIIKFTLKIKVLIIEMVDMMIWGIRCFGIEKCKQFVESVDFWKCEAFACNWHPAGAFSKSPTAFPVFFDISLLEFSIFFVLGFKDLGRGARIQRPPEGEGKMVVCGAGGRIQVGYRDLHPL